MVDVLFSALSLKSNFIGPLSVSEIGRYSFKTLVGASLRESVSQCALLDISCSVS